MPSGMPSALVEVLSTPPNAVDSAKWMERRRSLESSGVQHRALHALKQGGIFAKYELGSSPQKRFVWLSDDLKYLHWKQLGVVKAYSTVCVRDIYGVVQGGKTPVLQARGRDEFDHTHFSLILKQRSVDFGLHTVEACDTWVVAFMCLLQAQRRV